MEMRLGDLLTYQIHQFSVFFSVNRGGKLVPQESSGTEGLQYELQIIDDEFSEDQLLTEIQMHLASIILPKDCYLRKAGDNSVDRVRLITYRIVDITSED